MPPLLIILMEVENVRPYENEFCTMPGACKEMPASGNVSFAAIQMRAVSEVAGATKRTKYLRGNGRTGRAGAGGTVTTSNEEILSPIFDMLLFCIC